MFKKSILLFVSFIIGFSTFASPTVTDVVAKQRYPWNGLVDITCKVSGVEESVPYKVSLKAVQIDSGITNVVSQFWVVRNGVKDVNHTLNANGEYHFLWDAKADLGKMYCANMIVCVVLGREGVQLWEGGPYWATTNIGAEKPEDSGYYFWWGDTVGYKRENDKWVASDGSNSNFSFTSGNTPTYNKSVSTLQSEGWITADGVLAPEHDAAWAHWGGDWRMPTSQELRDLNSKCDWVSIRINGGYGYVVKGKGGYSTSSIFLPIAGQGEKNALTSLDTCYFWSSDKYPDSGRSYYLYGCIGGYRSVADYYRYLGYTIRPVSGTITIVASFTSEPFVLDMRDNPIVKSANITYNSSWIGEDKGATVVVAVNGMEIYRGCGEGDFEWTPQSQGKYELTYTTYLNGVPQEEVLSATLYKRAEILNLKAKQRFPWNGKVDIKFDVVGDVAYGLANWNTAELIVKAKDRVTGEDWVAKTLTGDIGINEGNYHVVWDMKADGFHFYSTNIGFKVLCSTKWGSSKKYCVIDLSGGKDATTYPVSYLSDVPKGGWTDEYKTTKLVLRFIEPGSIKNITISEPFFIGVFEVTQTQYELVTGKTPSHAEHKGDTLPVGNISWNMIRGDSSTHNWPTVKTVDSNSFVGLLQVKTGLRLDLPTQVQWEYACRAGTTEDCYWGMCSPDFYAWYFRNVAGNVQTVGKGLPNSWGLFDMSGNIAEWCLDSNGGWIKERIMRGGSAASSEVRNITSSISKWEYAYTINAYNGLRIVWHLGE